MSNSRSEESVTGKKNYISKSDNNSIQESQIRILSAKELPNIATKPNAIILSHQVLEEMLEKNEHASSMFESVSNSWKKTDESVLAYNRNNSNNSLYRPNIISEASLQNINKLKKPRNGYMIYMNEVYETVKSQHPELKFGELSTFIGRQWKSLSKEKQQPYHDRHEKEKIAYDNAKVAMGTSKLHIVEESIDDIMAKKSAISAFSNASFAAFTSSSPTPPPLQSLQMPPPPLKSQLLSIIFNENNDQSSLSMRTSTALTATTSTSSMEIAHSTTKNKWHLPIEGTFTSPGGDQSPTSNNPEVPPSKVKKL
ncbi:10402_t:CDS:2 [Entrophospora sp. SA101]|nr:10402_t:CDS:2 [Entrophospora sp. SA101]